MKLLITLLIVSAHWAYAEDPALMTASQLAIPAPKVVIEPGLELESQSADEGELFKEGLRLAKEGRYQEAGEIFEQITARTPDNAKAWNNLGLALRKQNRTTAAVDAYRQAMVTDPELSVVYKNMGVLLERLGDKRAASNFYRRYCKVAPAAKDVEQVAKRARWLDVIGQSARARLGKRSAQSP